MNLRNFLSNRSLVLSLLFASAAVTGCRDAEFIDIPLIQPSAIPTLIPPSPTPTPTPTPSPGKIYGMVTNALNGDPLDQVDVTVRLNGNRVREVFTNRAGNYDTGPLPGENYRVSYELDGFSPLLNVPITVPPGRAVLANQALSPLQPAGDWRIVLTWCNEKLGAVRDVDSYLLEPGEARPVSFANRQGVTANLDHDDTDWSGPETVTITNPSPTGTYIYYVNNWNVREDLLALGKSEIRVVIYRGNTVLRQYTINGGSGKTYEVFRIINGTFDTTQSLRYNDSLTVN